MAHSILFLLISVVLTVVWSQGEKTSDICNTTKIVPQLDMRDSNNIIGPKQQPINDRFLTEGWYHTDGQILLSSAPGFKRCGGLYPVWRNTSGVNVTMCIQTHVKPCHKKIEIETASCGEKKIYKLKRSSLHDAAYCFVWPGGKAPPVFPEKPEVIFGLVDDRTLEFKCAFKKHPDELWYRTYWHVNGRHIRTEGPSIWTDISTHNLTEEKLRNSNIHTVGFVIQCSVRVSETIKSPMSRPVFSDGEFIGIKVDNTSITLKPGESKNVYLQLTAPFGCRSVAMCRLYIELLQAVDEGLDVSTCGATVPKSDWNSKVSIRVYGRTTLKIHYSRRVLKLKLRTSENVHHPFWANYDLDLITVQLTTNTTILKEKACSATSDPHMKTFDGRRYENQREGVFTLYKHNHLPVEIQIKTARCMYIPGAWCTCGIAVRAGMTVYEMNRCHGYEKLNRYTQCDSGGDVLQVQETLETYKINLPTGGKLSVTEWKFFELTLFPSITDTRNCSGLCGILASGRQDDFFLSDGRYSKDDTNAFSESWRVNETKSLFNREILGNLSRWPRTHLLCHCDETTNQQSTNVNCSATEATTGSSNESKKKVCKQVPPGRRYTTPPQDTPVVTTDFVAARRRRRQSDSALQGGWTVEKARAFCLDSFRKSRSIQVCENVTSLEITESIEICVLDIQLTGTTDFTWCAIQNVREKCLHEVEFNPAYWKKENTTVVNQSIYDIVVEGACLNDCSGNGHCVLGVCVCESVYGGSDCSVDLTIPPTITYVENDGACDMTRDECFDISIYGNTFAEGQTKCLVEEIKVKDKKSEMVNSKSGTASFESIGHVICTIESSDDTDSDDVEYVRAFWISISNNGANYSTRVGVMVHYGTCVHPTVEGPYFKWSIEGPYCLYKGICVRHLEEQPGKECKVCDVYNNTRIWKDNTDSKCQSETHFPVAIVASCAALLVAITAVVVVMCVVRRRFTRNKYLVTKTSVRFSPTKMK